MQSCRLLVMCSAKPFLFVIMAAIQSLTIRSCFIQMRYQGYFYCFWTDFYAAVTQRFQGLDWCGRMNFFYMNARFQTPLICRRTRPKIVASSFLFSASYNQRVPLTWACYAKSSACCRSTCPLLHFQTRFQQRMTLRLFYDFLSIGNMTVSLFDPDVN
jgi:hypothetical protein